MGGKQNQVNARLDDALFKRFQQEVPAGKRSEFFRDAIQEKLDGGHASIPDGHVEFMPDWRQYDFSAVLREASSIVFYCQQFDLFVQLFKHLEALLQRSYDTSKSTLLITNDNSLHTFVNDILAFQSEVSSILKPFTVAKKPRSVILPELFLLADNVLFDSPFNDSFLFKWINPPEQRCHTNTVTIARHSALQYNPD